MNFPRTRQKIFVDAGAWIAHSNPSDQHHDTAVAMYTHLVQQRIPLLTTDYVVDEAITRLRYDATHARAVAFLDFMKDAVKRDAVTLERIDVDRFEEAEILFRRYRTARLSFTDCTSFVVCQEYEISEVFGFDQHFQIIKLNVLQ